MTGTLGTILIVASLGAATTAPAAVRPKVPVDRSKVTLGVSLGERPATAVVGLPALPATPVSIERQPVILSSPPVSIGRQPGDLSTPPAVVGPQPVDLSAPPVSIGPQPVILSSPPVSIGPQPVTLSAPPAVVGPQPVTLSAPPAVVGPQARDLGVWPVSIGPQPVILSSPPVSIGPQPVTLSAPPAVVGPQPVILSAPPAVVGPQARDLGVWPVSIGPQPVILSAPPAVVGPQPVTLSAPPAVVGPQPVVLSAPPVSIGPQPVILSAPPAVVGPQAKDLGVWPAVPAKLTAPFPSSPLVAKVGTSAMPQVGAAVRLTLPESLDAGGIDGGRFMRLVLSCEDDPALRHLLTASGLTLRDAGQARTLPEFFTAVGCNSRVEHSREDAAALQKIASPCGIRVLRFVDRSGEAVDYAAAHPDEKYIVIAEPSGLSVKALGVLAGANIVAVVVGHYHAADVRPEDYPDAAQKTLAAVKAIRLVSDAPVLLAVSATNWLTRRTEKSWPQSFGNDLAGFDGWAVYNLAQFPAILEAPSNPRQLVLERLGLAQKPCLLIEFMGTRDRYKPAEASYIRRVWKAKAPALVKALKEQQWRGLIVWSANIDDAALKAEALKAIPAK